MKRHNIISIYLLITILTIETVMTIHAATVGNTPILILSVVSLWITSTVLILSIKKDKEHNND